MKKIIYLILASALVGCGATEQKTQSSLPTSVTMSKEVLLDKIKGGWAGQTIGCTYGGLTEFKYNGTMIQDYVKVEWRDSLIKWWYDNAPGLYDDVYMDATFVKVFERSGLDASVEEFADAFANAEYPLWHANQAARYNILNGIKAPDSGNWKHNFHADDIDFQIEADFAGLMSPAMVNSAIEICDKIGHIMNYGDGYYGGVFVASMYSLAFVSDDIELIVNEALKTIPENSNFYKCIADVIKYHKAYPNDWKQTWFEMQKRWTEDLYCSAFIAFNIEAKINAAYIVMGLLYGEGDFTKTMDISMRCGYDSDCNPANAAGILATIIGYNNIPKEYLTSVQIVEDIDFVHTYASLNDIYKMSYNQALNMIAREGGRVEQNSVEIPVQVPQTVPFELSFPNYYPSRYLAFNKSLEHLEPFEFEGVGIVFNGEVSGDNNYIAIIELIVDGEVIEKANLPVDFAKRRHEISYCFELPQGNHTASIKWLNPQKGANIFISDIISYTITNK